MMNRKMRSSIASLVTLSVIALLGALACIGSERENVPPQGWWEDRGPVIPHDSFPADCSLCHTGDNWVTIREDFSFDHEVETGVPLLGAHEQAECLRCHNDRGPVEVFVQRGCRGCHADVHRGKLGSDCEDCHDEQDWRPDDAIALHNRTRFPLVGAHAATECWRCHFGAESGNFTPVDVECTSCHLPDLARATDPDHQAAGWTTRCDRCHIPIDWRGAGFVHGGFPLVGGHALVDCSVCHVGGVFEPLDRSCASCHGDDYLAATDPEHAGSGFPMQCELCHDVYAWEGARVNHSLFSGPCAQCHLDEYQATTNPSHIAEGFPETCEACHTTTSWSPADFNHSFPIADDHAGLQCIDCHIVPGSYPGFSCTHCHDHSQLEMAKEHEDVEGYVWENAACLSCHPDGRE
jgi:hypothetical protein